MSTALSAELDAALAAVPAKLRSRLIDRYRDLKSALATGNYDAAGLRAGRFAEIVLRVLQHQLTGTYTPLGEPHGADFASECAKLERLPKTAGPESLRVIMPRALNFLYTLRNKRSIGHEGGDLDANEIDAATAVRLADWCLCELIRVHHSLPIEEAQAVVDAVAVRQIPDVWSVAGTKRVLRPGLTYTDRMLILLYGEIETAVPIEDICEWVEHPRLADMRKDVLRSAHKKGLVHYDRSTETVVISPEGARHVETTLLRT